MKTIVLTREQAQNFTSPQPYAVISISDSDREAAKIPESDQMAAILRLHFDDVDNREAAENLGKPHRLLGTDEWLPGREVQMFDAKLAQQILDFWGTVKDQIEVLMVHCNAGQCRSPAVAAALARVEGESDEQWFRTRTPNRLVYRTILEQHYSPEHNEGDPWSALQG